MYQLLRNCYRVMKGLCTENLIQQRLGRRERHPRETLIINTSNLALSWDPRNTLWGDPFTAKPIRPCVLLETTSRAFPRFLFPTGPWKRLSSSKRSERCSSETLCRLLFFYKAKSIYHNNEEKTSQTPKSKAEGTLGPRGRKHRVVSG